MGTGPNDSLLTPDVLRRGTWPPFTLLLNPVPVGVESVVVLVVTDDTDPGPRLRDRIVILPGSINEGRGDARGGVIVGPGSLERADCTRASRRCIWAVSDRMCEREVDGAIPLGAARGAAGFAGTGRGAVVVVRDDTVADLVGGREDAEDDSRGRGVTLESMDGNLDFFCLVGAVTGVLIGGTLAVFGKGGGAEASDMGGEGGSLTGVLVDETEAVSGGVDTMGELAPDIVLRSNIGLSRTEMSVDMVDMWRSLPCFFNLSWRISASTFKSESSSFSLCASIRSCSRSCSPILISSSIMTARSIAALYLDSRSSRDELVCRACRSKSSFATSMSRSLCCSVRLVSLKAVISFSRVFCAALASVFESLYFLCRS